MGHRLQQFLPFGRIIELGEFLRQIQIIPTDDAILDEPFAGFGHLLVFLLRLQETLLTEEGETNPIRHAIDVRYAGIRQRLAERPENIDNPEIQKAARRLWGEDVFKPTFRSFKAGLVHSIPKALEEIPEGIRPREEFKSLTEALHRQKPMGRPDVPISVAFMAGGGSRSQPDRTRLCQGKLDESHTCERLKQLGEEEGSISGSPWVTLFYFSFQALLRETRRFTPPNTEPLSARVNT
jgi:hypothetical protein